MIAKSPYTHSHTENLASSKPGTKWGLLCASSDRPTKLTPLTLLVMSTSSAWGCHYATMWEAGIFKKKTKAEKQANIIKGTVKDQRNGKWMKNGKKGWREGKWQKTEICQLARLNRRGFWVLAVVHRIWTQTVGCPWDLSILLLLTDFNQSLYLECKPTPKMLKFWFLPSDNTYLKCMKEVALCLVCRKRPVT